jgi:ABC-type antimicrobial peptide transport system permease subunit
MTHSRNFLKGFLIGLTVFILANFLAAHLFSDCGLPALFGLGACADAISRTGFPFVFLEQGGFAYHSDFNLLFLILDLLIGLGFAVLTGFFMHKLRKKVNP